MGNKAEVLDTNIEDIANRVTNVGLEYGTVTFRGENIFQNKSIFLGSASAILLFDTDKFNTVFKIEFNGSKFLVLSCKTDYYLKNIKTLRLKGDEPFKVTSSISGIGICGAFFGVILLFAMFSSGSARSPSQASSKVLTQSHKSDICKAYIGQIFGKPVSIINNFRSDGDLIYVSYIRSVDDTKWSYMCDLSGGTISWAAWHSDTQEWGRWRNEDESDLDYNPSTNTVSFEVQGSKVSVQL